MFVSDSTTGCGARVKVSSSTGTFSAEVRLFAFYSGSKLWNKSWFNDKTAVSTRSGF